MAVCPPSWNRSPGHCSALKFARDRRLDSSGLYAIAGFFEFAFWGEEALAYAGNNSSHGTSVRGASLLYCTHFGGRD